ncbi:hypothetical protein EMIHUDRAFT_466602 [Emiliania huxleyi CCMP1516]|uniref:Uncharacterized protein n=2 Tax=Emiliania huxleyi TaxID=2903 RepID=A0A0D3IZ33_EMIH1|nr:hypothetical protein EMIHUDRAFT_470423 [Emiliania huxleyi CCMP1516]XP_005792364.1 hypothetical protein EMIHUDRAFT_466602 [Emiliania huxleyi CCMP1516]EOD16518.1 hypothetical protein EMIHUDRAFT_470423 [Emiliania huxleyi CCMP1516]EOD39935.1 hypothetical protein EMIHUDRAFT_466602 [Emiliania huxleyi CCMP1516]|eukprot:XP_005768947.1 hypothetical protein EMIHUDRAFT_470423 [Emiliania huxleyi CCMP1516]
METLRRSYIRFRGGAALQAELNRGSERVALVGATPGGAQCSRLGVFVKRHDLINGMPSYEKDGDPSVMMWYSGGWKVGDAKQLGRKGCGISCPDDAFAPETATRAWRVNLPAGGGWCDAPDVRCIAGAALSEELKRAAARVALVGKAPKGAQDASAWMGVFSKCDEEVNGHPSYELEGNGEVMLWHAADCWYVGNAEDAGEQVGFLSVRDGALLPQSISRVWRVKPKEGDAKKKKKEKKKGKDDWVDAAEVRLLAERPTASRVYDAATSSWVETATLIVFEDSGPPGRGSRVSAAA